MEFSFTSANTNTYRIVIAQNNDNPTISIYGPHPKAVLPGLCLICRSFKKTTIPWQGNEGEWIPDDVRHFCDKLAKNKAFL
jgi:hypothetical protein